MNEKPLISIITTVKNRLAHLKQSLPKMVQQSHCEVIVVDCQCGEGSSQWIENNYSNVRIIKDEGHQVFCAACGRNKGASIAQGELLLFIDADQILEGDLGLWIVQNYQKGFFYEVGEPRSLSAWGIIICAKEDFIKIGGYDEAFGLWGGEDIDLVNRLRALGCKKNFFSSHYINSLEHGDELRAFVNADGVQLNKETLIKIFSTYMQIKYDITSIVKQTPVLKERKALFKKVEISIIDAVYNHGKPTISISFPINSRTHLKERKLVYQF
ncbi:MAG: glycosyltransferase [Campylobacterales bacterium]|nr:glycosyltransferase [Campylobacterales bacterium]